MLRDFLAGERLELFGHGYRKGTVEASSQDAMWGKNTGTSAIYPGHQFDDVRLGCETTASVYHMCALKPAHVIIFRGYLIGSDREIYRGDRISCDYLNGEATEVETHTEWLSWCYRNAKRVHDEREREECDPVITVMNFMRSLRGVLPAACPS